MARKELGINIKWNTNTGDLRSLHSILAELDKDQQKLETEAKNLGRTFGDETDKMGNKSRNLQTQLTRMDWGTKGVKQLGDSIKTVSGHMTGLISAATAAGKALLSAFGLGGVGITGLIGKGLSDYANFSKQVNLAMTAIAPGAGVDQLKARQFVEEQLKKNASQTGVGIEGSAASLYQLASIPGIAPDIKTMQSDPKKYQQDLQNVLDIQKKLDEYAASQNQDVAQVGQNYARLANALKVDPKSMSGLNYTLEFINAGITHGVTNMEQLQGQFSKIVGPAERAGATMEQATSLVLSGTMQMGADASGEGAKSLLTQFGKGFQTSKEMAESVKNQLTAAVGTQMPYQQQAMSKLMAQHNYSAASQYMGADSSISKEDFVKLAKYTEQGSWNEIFYSGGKEKSFDDKLKSMIGRYNQEGLGDAGKTIMQGAISKEENASRLFGILAQNGGMEQYGSIEASMNNAQKVKDLGEQRDKHLISAEEYEKKLKEISTASQAVDTYNQSFAHAWNTIATKVSNVSLTIGDAFAPAMMGIVHAMDLVNGSADDMRKALTDGFNETAKKLDAIYPGLGKFADTLKNIALWFTTDDAKKFFTDVAAGIQQTLSFLGELVGKIGKLLADHKDLINWFLSHPIAIPLVAAGLDIVGSAISSTIVTAIVSALTGGEVATGMMAALAPVASYLIPVIGAGLVAYMAAEGAKKLILEPTVGKYEQSYVGAYLHSGNKKPTDADFDAINPPIWGGTKDQASDTLSIEMTKQAAKQVEKLKSASNPEGWFDPNNKQGPTAIIDYVLNHMNKGDIDAVASQTTDAAALEKLKGVAMQMINESDNKEKFEKVKNYAGELAKKALEGANGLSKNVQQKNFESMLDALVSSGSLDDMDAALLKHASTSTDDESKNDAKAALHDFLTSKKMKSEDIDALLNSGSDAAGKKNVSDILSKSGLSGTEKSIVTTSLFGNEGGFGFLSSLASPFSSLLGLGGGSKDSTAKKEQSFYDQVKQGMLDAQKEAKPPTVTVNVTLDSAGNTTSISQDTSAAGSEQKPASLMDFGGRLLQTFT